MLKLCVLTRWDFNFCVRNSPLRGTPTVCTIDECNNTNIHLPSSDSINKSLYCKIKQYILFTHSYPCYFFLYSFIYVALFPLKLLNYKTTRLRQVPNGSGEQRKMEKTGCKSYAVPKRPSRKYHVIRGFGQGHRAGGYTTEV